MVRRAFVVILLGAVTVLAAVAPAHGSDTVYVVTGTADVLGTCAAMPNVPNAFTCDSLRTAVAAADLNAGDDAIVLQNAGTYPLTRGVVNLATGVTIYGQGPRSTTIQGNGKDRVFSVAPDVSVDLAAVTISGGAVVGDGGNVLNAGDLSLTWVHVTNGRATNGGGLANQATGTLTVLETLIDANQVSAASGGSQGGGIFNRGRLEVDDSTIFNNTAGSVGAIASASGSVSLSHATIAQNSSTAGTGGISIVGSWVSFGSILVNNRGDGGLSNCGSAAGPGSYGNLEDGQTCGALTSGAIGLATTLSNQGGPTDVLTIPATGPAKGFVTPCASGIDQRYAPRPAAGGRCDAGAFEQGATPQPIPAFPIPTPTPSPTPVPTATPTATPTPTPTPVAGKTVVAKVVKGTVRVRRPGTNTFVELDGTQGIPVGATLDTKHGTVQLTSLQTAGGRPQTASFFDGIFKLTQTKKTTDLTLNEQLAACPKGKAAAAAKKKPKSRRLWGDGSGAFRTRGQYSAATVRGTKWLVQDSCKGTLTRVARGAVTVRDRIRRKTILLRAGRSYLAKPRR